MSIQDYNSLISLYSEIESTVSPKQLEQIETPDSEIAQKIAQDFFLVSRESKTGGKTTVSLHFQKKHFYDFIWGKVRSFFGCKPPQSFAFTTNFELIKKSLEAIPRDAVQEPKKLERLRNIANAMVRHVEGESHSRDHEITRTFLATTVDSVKLETTTPIAPSRVTPKGPTPLSETEIASVKPEKTTQTAPSRFTPQAPTPLNETEKEFVRLIRGDQKGDRAFLSALMKYLRDNKSQNWIAIRNKALFKAVGHKGENLTMNDLCNYLDKLFEQGSDSTKLDPIVASLQKLETLDLDEFKHGYDREGRAKESKEYQTICQLMHKPEMLSPAEKIAFKVPEVCEFLNQVRKGESASVDACKRLLSFIEMIDKVETSLEKARADAKTLTSLPDCIKLPELPAKVDISSTKTIMGARNAYENASVAIADIEDLMKLQENYLEFLANLKQIKDKAKTLRDEYPLLVSFMPCAKPLFDELEGRDPKNPYHDFYNKAKTDLPPFQNRQQFENWLKDQIELMQQYTTGIDALEKLNSAFLGIVGDKAKKEELSRASFLKPLLEKSLPQSDVRDHIREDLKIVKGGEEPRVRGYGYFNRLLDAQEDLMTIQGFAQYNFDKYIAALTEISGAFIEAINEYNKIFAPIKEGKGKYIEPKNRYNAFKSKYQATFAKLDKMLEAQSKLGKSARTEYLTNLSQEFEERIPEKATQASNRVLASSVIGCPPRLSTQVAFTLSKPPQDFDKAQNAYLAELKAPESKKGSISFEDLILQKGKRDESPATPEDEQDWGD